MHIQTLDLTKLYRLPWSKYNNPNGWIEPTTFCQLACPGCYRGLAFPHPLRTHEDINKMKRQIDTLIKIRNIKILSVAGGEPLLYPKLNALISYATSRGLKTRLVTNGAALTTKRLKELKNRGVCEVVIHLAHYQSRGRFSSEKEVNMLRERYCQMFREVGGIELGFIITMSKRNIDQIKTLIDFYQKNSDVISRTYFTLYRDFLFKKSQKENSSDYLNQNVLINSFRKFYNTEPCVYLPKKLNQKEPAWLLFAPIFLGEKPIAYADAKTAENLDKKSNPGQWSSFPVGASNPQLLKSISFVSFETAKRVVKGYLKEVVKHPKNIFKMPKCQIIIIINLPVMTKDGWDLCDGCPDAMLYQNRLVPSCLLERIKSGEKIVLN